MVACTPIAVGILATMGVGLLGVSVFIDSKDRGAPDAILDLVQSSWWVCFDHACCLGREGGTKGAPHQMFNALRIRGRRIAHIVGDGAI
jgi:hypothetical protein